MVSCRSARMFVAVDDGDFFCKGILSLFFFSKFHQLGDNKTESGSNFPRNQSGVWGSLIDVFDGVMWNVVSVPVEQHSIPPGIHLMSLPHAYQLRKLMSVANAATPIVHRSSWNLSGIERSYWSAIWPYHPLSNKVNKTVHTISRRCLLTLRI